MLIQLTNCKADASSRRVGVGKGVNDGPRSCSTPTSPATCLKRASEVLVLGRSTVGYGSVSKRRVVPWPPSSRLGGAVEGASAQRFNEALAKSLSQAKTPKHGSRK